MFFNSYEFLFGFLPVVTIVYFLLARFRGPVTWWLLAASLFFYARYRIDDLGVLIASLVWNFLIVRLIARGRWRGFYLLAGISVDLGVLAVFKYAGFFKVHALQNLAFPLGISFFTFSQIACLVDVYRGIDRPSSIRDYALFVSFFPHLLSGPILRHKQMIPQFDSVLRQRPIPRNLARGLTLIVIGLAKKILIADTLAPLVAKAFDPAGTLNAATAWIGTTAYTFQLYNDFSGYCDIAVGVALLLNIRIPENFHAPYRSTSIQEFWRRWHISLSRFLRDYIYVPLGGSRAGVFRQCAAVMVTFILGGLWHGAGWTFLVWGALHGVALTLHVLWKRAGLRMPALIGWALTISFVDLSWVAFRAPDLTSLRRVWGAMFSAAPQFAPAFLKDPVGLTLLVAMLLTAFPAYSYVMARRLRPTLLTAALAAVMLTVAVVQFSGVSYFLYYFF